jgi:SAM-dependent methyltransferase
MENENQIKDKEKEIKKREEAQIEAENLYENKSDEEENLNFESNLGKKDYWDNAYDKEINIFNNNKEEIGYLFCGKQVQNKTIQYIKNNFKNKNINILDIGCGNGGLLFELVKLGYYKLKGMDYSEKSIELAYNIKKHKLNSGDKLCENIEFYQEDINNPISEKEGFFYDIINDQGTFDAYMLNRNNSYLNYANYLNLKMKDKSVLIISSVNHLKKELLEFFLNIDFNSNLNIGFRFELVEEIPHKSFNYGGNFGQTITTLVFKKNKIIYKFILSTIIQLLI